MSGNGVLWLDISGNIYIRVLISTFYVLLEFYFRYGSTVEYEYFIFKDKGSTVVVVLLSLEFFSQHPVRRIQLQPTDQS